MTAPDAAGIEAALAAGLAAHAAVGLVIRPQSRAYECTCGAIIETTDAPITVAVPDEIHAAFRAHVAAALLPVVTQAQAEALREAADAMGRAARDGGSHWRAHAWANWLRERANRLGGDA